jgi:hypothetical protein
MGLVITPVPLHLVHVVYLFLFLHQKQLPMPSQREQSSLPFPKQSEHSTVCLPSQFSHFPQEVKIKILNIIKKINPKQITFLIIKIVSFVYVFQTKRTFPAQWIV